MTVGELINQLDKYDKNMNVVFCEYILEKFNGYTGYFPEPREITAIDDKMFNNCITLILDT